MRILLVAAGILIIAPETISSAIGYAIGIVLVLLVNFKAFKEENRADKGAMIRLILMGVAGALIIVPESITTILGLVLFIVTIIYAILKGRKNKSDNLVVVEAAEVIQVDLVDVEED